MMTKHYFATPLMALFLVTALMAVAVPTLAHQLKSAETTITLNRRAGTIEIAHRFYVHDAEHAAAKVLGSAGDIIKSKATQAAFSQYITDHFVLKHAKDKKALKLTTIGHEIDGKFLWVYQEIPMTALMENGVPFSQLWVKHSALQEIWPKQINLVNLEGFGASKTDIQSFTARRGADSHFFKLD